MVLRLWLSFHTEMGIGGGYQVLEFPESGCGQNISRYLTRTIGSRGEIRSERKQAKGAEEMANGQLVLRGGPWWACVPCGAPPTLGVSGGLTDTAPGVITVP